MTHPLQLINIINYMCLQRKDWVDASKAIGILLMVAGHSSLPKYLSDWIYSFHMPLFFILSGYCSSWISEFISFFKRRTFSIMSYFFIYSLINFLILQLIPTSFEQKSFCYLITHGWEGFALWFLPVLYVGQILAFFIKSKYDTYAIILLSCIAGYLSYHQIQLPWAASSIPIATTFIVIGRKLKVIINTILHLSIKKKLILLIFTLTLSTSISFYVRCDIANNQILPLIPILAAGCTGSLFIFLIANSIVGFRAATPILRYIGKNTIEVLAFSQIVIIALNYYEIGYIFKYPIMLSTVCLFSKIRQAFISLLKSLMVNRAI